MISAGLSDSKPKPRYTLAQLESNWSPEFERLCRNRLMMGCLRYGHMDEQRTNHKWDVLKAIGAKVQAYELTGNTEHIVDAANYCQLVFVLDPHPTKHFSALDDHSDHCELRK